MKKYRIGNDLKISWSLFSEAEPFIVEGLDCTLWLKDRYSSKAVTDFEIKENTVSFTFLGMEQKRACAYSLVLVINSGRAGMRSVDLRDVFALVEYSDQAGGLDEANVCTEALLAASSKVEFGDIESVRNRLAAFEQTTSEFLGRIIEINPTNDAPTLIAAFQKYGFKDRIGIPIPCFYKQERFDKEFLFGFLTVADYTQQNCGYRLTFLSLPCSPPAKTESGEIDYEAIYNNDVPGEVKAVSYLYDPNSGYVLPLGEGREYNSGIVTRKLLSLQSRVDYLEKLHNVHK